MSRLIDADALINDIENNLWDWESVNGIKAKTVLKQTITDIRNQPTIGWHYPSKGEYPPEEGFYLVTIETSEGRGRFVSMINYSATLDNPTRRWIDCMGLEETRIIAWMPLPEPPKENA